ncbi:LysM peptidoglycan-binding domain-containing protein [Alphaproteobacteria bacterium]|nr:LysM peptidoglycan-binding domain-containing protein [Alphaproteobacteria bacterium]
MKNSFIWFLGLVSVLLVGTFFAIPSDQTKKNDEISNALNSEEITSETSMPDTAGDLGVDSNINKSENAVTATTQQEAQAKLQVTMAQVSPDGTSVFGGVGPAGQTVLLFNGDSVIAEAIINEKGDWVAIPETIFEAGSHFIQLAIKPNADETDKQETNKLSLTVVTEPVSQNPPKLDENEGLPLTPNSTPATQQSQDAEIADLAVVIDIEENKQDKPLVVFVPKSDTSIPVIVQTPNQFTENQATIKSGDTGIVSNDGSDEERLRSVASVLDTADQISNIDAEPEFIQIRSLSWENKSTLRLSGFASGGYSMRAYFDDQFIASIELDSAPTDNKAYRWSMVAEALMQPNRNYPLLAELIDKNGNIIKKSSINVSLEALAIGEDGSEMMVIHKGDALWRIAYRAYGQGVRYVDIFKRNNERINDPDLIFPNQIFAIPD